MRSNPERRAAARRDLSSSAVRWLTGACMIAISVPGVAVGQDPTPVLVLVDPGSSAAEPQAVREAVARELRRPVVALIEERDSDTTLTIAFHPDGQQAEIRARTGAGQPAQSRVQAPPGAASDGTWVASEARRALEEGQLTRAASDASELQACMEVIDPWRGRTRRLAAWDGSLIRRPLVGAARLASWDGIIPIGPRRPASSAVVPGVRPAERASGLGIPEPGH